MLAKLKSLRTRLKKPNEDYFAVLKTVLPKDIFGPYLRVYSYLHKSEIDLGELELGLIETEREHISDGGAVACEGGVTGESPLSGENSSHSVALAATREKQKKRYNKKKKEKRKCFYCDMIGQVVKDCRKRKSEKEAKDEDNTFAPLLFCSNTAMETSSFSSRPDEVMWLADSGATNHATNDRSILHK